jgi:trimethylamine:corrinoid methyltransferase-like protein
MPFNLLSSEEVEALHHATLRILAETGIALTEPRSRAMRCS